MRQITCYQCKEKLPKEDAIQYIHKTENHEYKRYFHGSCLELFKQIIDEKKKWDELYEYVRSEIFRYDKKQSLSKHCVSRLQGLRCGNYGVKSNTKVFLSENGYPYEIILLTFKLKKTDIVRAISDRSKFQSEQQQIDYMIAIIQNNINDIYLRVKEKEKSDRRLEQIELTNTNDRYQFINKSNIKENKVANKLKHLF
jgi:hypothetical protein